jgi:hypothetical protein
MSISTRLAKLERNGPIGDIPVWCGTEAEVPATIKAMLAGAGERFGRIGLKLQDGNSE